MTKDRCEVCTAVPGTECPDVAGVRVCDFVRTEAKRRSVNPSYRGYWSKWVEEKSAGRDYTPAMGRPGSPSQNWAVRPRPNDRVLIRTHLYADGGYGQIGEWLGRGLTMLGLPVVYEEIVSRTKYFDVQQFILDRKILSFSEKWELLLDTPNGGIKHGRRGLHFSMWEATKISMQAVLNLNRADLVCVPSKFCRQIFEESGVTRPIRIVPLGVSADEGYVPSPLPPADLCIFGTAGRMGHGGNRKGIVVAAKAFLKAFPSEQDVRLRIKVLPECLEGGMLDDLPVDRRIRVRTTPMLAPQVAEWTKGNTAGVFAHCSEGFGLHPAQFMACGRPVIMTGATGDGEYFDERFGFVVPHEWKPARDFYTDEKVGGVEGALWAEPTEEGLIEGYRWVYEHRDEAAAKGAAAAVRAQEFTWMRTALDLRAALIECGLLADPEHPYVEPATPSYPSNDQERAYQEDMKFGETITPEQLRIIETCPHRQEKQVGCCDRTVCLYDGNRIRAGRSPLAECGRCIQAHLPR